MPLYAGVCETNITPWIGTQMTGYGWVPQTSLAIHDELYARAIVLDDGDRRVCLLTADILGVSVSLADEIRTLVARATRTVKAAVMLNCSHTHGGPHTGVSVVGAPDAQYLYALIQKLVGVATQAAGLLVPIHLTYGETSTQIGVNRRLPTPDGKTILAPNYSGAVLPLTQNLIVNGADGRTLAMLFSHACHPTTLDARNRNITGDWPGAAVAHLKRKFQKEGADSGIHESALPLFLQGCCGDIDPVRRGDWEAMEENGRQIAESAHAARWNAHGRLDETLSFAETTLQLPVLSSAGDSGARTLPFSIQRLTLGGVSFLGFPAEMFVQYALDYRTRNNASVFLLGNTNGCLGYFPTTEEHHRGGYEIDEAHQYYGKPSFSPECEALVRDAIHSMLAG